MYKALIVDDDAAVLSTLRMLFQARHFEVTTATCARDAVLILGKNSFDLVVTDMRMETHTSGFDVVRNAKSLSCAPVVVILSAFPIPANEWRTVGADAIFAKGAGSFAMIKNIEDMLNSQVRARSAS